ncbi:MAG: hypothetical protein U5L11_01410 [Arhodomonas sp.]|nr:hypothetical protein [Arhodomonas sp.]
MPRPRDIVHGGERVPIHAQLEPEGAVQAQAIPLGQPPRRRGVAGNQQACPGLVVHPGAGNPADTLQNACIGKLNDPALETLPRAGIVHRLDRDCHGPDGGGANPGSAPVAGGAAPAAARGAGVSGPGGGHLHRRRPAWRPPSAATPITRTRMAGRRQGDPR